MADTPRPPNPQNRIAPAVDIDSVPHASSVATHRRGEGQRYYTYRPRPEARM